MSVKEAATYAGIPFKTLEQLARDGEVPCVRIGGRVYYRPERLDAWLDEIEFVPSLALN